MPARVDGNQRTNVEMNKASATTPGALGLAAFLVGHAIVLWKMDWRYDRP
jgi:hypothetical protein